MQANLNSGQTKPREISALQTRLILSFVFFMLISGAYSQATVTPSDHPCAGHTFTVTFPTTAGGCTPRVTSVDISPTPGANDYYREGFSSLTGIPYIEVRYASYQASIDVVAHYTCPSGSTGEFEKVITMTPALSANPTISGLDQTTYPNDTKTITASVSNAPLGTTYSWQLNNVDPDVGSGSISSTAILSPASATSQLKIPNTFFGEFDLKATASVCDGSTQSTKHVTVLPVPDAHLSQISSSPNYETDNLRCPGTEVTYSTFFSGQPTSPYELYDILVQLSGGGSYVTITGSPFPSSWKIKWNSNGSLKVTYYVREKANHSRTWTFPSEKSYTVDQFNPGELNQSDGNTYCSPRTVQLSIKTQPVGHGGYTFQYCNTGDCNVNSSSWINQNPAISTTFSNLSNTTNFRIRLNETRCNIPNQTSAAVRYNITPTPSITTSNVKMFSGGMFPIPPVDAFQYEYGNLATIAVTVDTTGVSGASNASGNSGSLSSQTLTSKVIAGGIATYHMTPALAGCTGQTKNATVTVYAKPTIYSNPKGVYKGSSVTLSTDTYDSYQWRTASDSLLGTAATYHTSKRGDYKLKVIKSGLQAVTDLFTVGGQLDGVNENYVLTRQPLKEFSSTSGFEDKTEIDITETIQYFDAIGRPTQSINIRTSPGTHRDMVQPVSYDVYGRETKKYLPYISTQDNGRIQYNAITNDQPQFFQQESDLIPNDPAAFAETIFESSPLNRVLKQGAPGTDWQPATDHAIKKEYKTNTANEVRLFAYSAESGIATTIYYPAGSLGCLRTIDEHQNDILEFTDKEGRIVCKKVKAATGIYASTYYVYDDVGNLVVVIPPEGVERILNPTGN